MTSLGGLNELKECLTRHPIQCQVTIVVLSLLWCLIRLMVFDKIAVLRRARQSSDGWLPFSVIVLFPFFVLPHPHPAHEFSLSFSLHFCYEKPDAFQPWTKLMPHVKVCSLTGTDMEKCRVTESFAVFILFWGMVASRGLGRVNMERKWLLD